MLQHDWVLTISIVKLQNILDKIFVSNTVGATRPARARTFDNLEGSPLLLKLITQTRGLRSNGYGKKDIPLTEGY